MRSFLRLVMPALALAACTATTTSTVTFVRPVSACSSRVGSACVHDYETVTERRPGACVEQTVGPEERMVGCLSHRDDPSGPIAVSAVLGGAVILGIVGMMYFAYVGQGLAHTH